MSDGETSAGTIRERIFGTREGITEGIRTIGEDPQTPKLTPGLPPLTPPPDGGGTITTLSPSVTLTGA